MARSDRLVNKRLDPETKELLRRLAEAEKRSMTAEIVWLVRERARVLGLAPVGDPQAGEAVLQLAEAEGPRFHPRVVLVRGDQREDGLGVVGDLLAEGLEPAAGPGPQRLLRTAREPSEHVLEPVEVSMPYLAVQALGVLLDLRPLAP